MKVVVGIFWVIHGKIYAKWQEKDKEKGAAEKRTVLTGKIDSDYGHFEKWDETCAALYPYADFSTFPRGRVLYDVQKEEHILYADRCISTKKLGEIATLCEAKEYRVERDEHYRCDKCMKEEGGIDG